MTISQWLLLAGASTLAGLVNAVAGGGTLLTFPALVVAGVSPVAANATNTVALFPGQLVSSWAYRGHLGDEKRRALVLSVPSVLGGILGSALLLGMPEHTFEAVVPWLILFACTTLALQGPLRAVVANVRGASHPAALWIAQLLISIYGGYFGAGIGILMLAAMGILLPSSMQHANALKVLFSFLINAIAALIFIALGAARLPVALFMAVASMVGGYIGVRVAQRLPPAGMRGFAIAVGLYAAARFLFRS